MVLYAIIKQLIIMRFSIIYFIAGMWCCTRLNAQTEDVPVFISGTEGYKTFRIPAIIKAPDGELLAFCEGRLNGMNDFGNIKIVEKRSADNGKTWSGLQVAAANDTLQTGNVAPVVDRTDPDYPNGRIFLFFNTGNASETQVRKGKGLREVWYKTSVDNGLTWSSPVNITLQVHKPRQPQANKDYNFMEDWRAYANTPGHAIQFQEGKYKGRIYMAANHSAGEPQKHYTDGRAFGYYTDDHGKTFKISDDVNVPGGNEVMAAELSNNKLLLNIRNQAADTKDRIIAVSNNGGGQWAKTFHDPRLPDPVCQGSVLSMDMKGKFILAVCNDADTVRRDDLTLRISFDEGKTWKKNFLIAKSPEGYTGDYSAYSDLVPLSKRETGLLYEKNNYKQIVFTAQRW